MEYQSFKSQALDFNVYSDGIDVVAVTPQYALTRKNTADNIIEYYSTTSTTANPVWKDLISITATAEEIATALGNLQGDNKDADKDAWWDSTKFETLLSRYWNTEDNAYLNTLWICEKTEYSTGDPTYSAPRADTGGSAIGKWCSKNDRTLIHGAHIATGTIDADRIKANSITTDQLNSSVLSAKNIVVSGSGNSAVTLDDSLNSLAGVNLAASKYVLPFEDITMEVNDYVYRLTTKKWNDGLQLASAIFKPNTNYVVSYKFKIISGAEAKYISGHSEGFTINKAIVDGEDRGDTSYESPGYDLENTTNGVEHSVILYLTRSAATNKSYPLYIQPQRNPDDADDDECTMEVWDLQVREGVRLVAWEPPYEDTQASIQEAGKIQVSVENLANPTTATVVASGGNLENGIYTVYTTKPYHGIKLAESIFELNQSYVVSFRLKDLYGESKRTDGGIIPEDIKPTIKITAIGGHCQAFTITKAIIDGKIPATNEKYDPGYSLDPTKTIHTVMLVVTRDKAVGDVIDNGNITITDASLYIQPGRKHSGTTLSEIWDLVVTEGTEATEMPTSWTNYQYTITDSGLTNTVTEPASDATWVDSFPSTWKGSGNVWRRTITTYVDGTVNYSNIVRLSTADSARRAAELAIANGEEWIDNGETKKITSLGDWCLKYNVTIIDGANIMTGTIDASKVKVTNLDASNITAGMFTVGVDGDDENKTLDEHEIIFQAGYTEGENGAKAPLVKIGGFNVAANKLTAGSGNGYVSLQTTQNPLEYTPAEYIEFSGTQYIDTGVIIDYDNDVVEITVQPTVAEQNGMFFGVWDAANSTGEKSAVFYHYGESGGTHTIMLYVGGGKIQNLNSTIPTTDLTKHTYRFEKKTNYELSVDGITKATTETNWTIDPESSRTSCIGAAYNANGVANWRYQGRIYRCKIWRGGQLYRDFIPVWKEGYGLYDNCFGKFYPNNGTGKIGGALVHSLDATFTLNGIRYTRLEYIQNNGVDNYIDTGLNLNFGTGFTVEAEVMPTAELEPNNRCCILSSYNGDTGDLNNFSFELFENGEVDKARAYVTQGNPDLMLGTVNENTKNTVRYTVSSRTVQIALNGNTDEATANLTGDVNASPYIFVDRLKRFDTFNVLMRLYSMKVYSGGTLIAHYLPVLNGEQVPGLVNLTTGQFLTTPSGSLFTYGAYESKAGRVFVSGENSYRELEYIESPETSDDKAAYINTGEKTKATTAIEIDAMIYQGKSYYGGTASKSLNCTTGGDGLNYFYHYDSAALGKSSNSVIRVRTVVKQDGKNCYRDGVLVATATNSFPDNYEDTNPILLGGRCSASGVLDDAGGIRIYACKIWQNGNLVKYFIPVIENETTYGLYDQVNKQFYKSANTNPEATNFTGKGYDAEFTAFYLGAPEPELAPFSVTNTGKLKATAGEIGGWELDRDKLVTKAYSASDYGTGMTATKGKYDPAFYAGFRNIGEGTTPWEEPNGVDWKNHTAFYVTNEGYMGATKGEIGGFTIDTDSIASGDAGTDTGIKLTSGATGTTPVIQAGTKFSVDASGNIEAEGGNIGGWEIDGTKKTLSSGKGTATVGLKATGNTKTPAIWAGATDADNAPCRIYPDGKFQLYKGTIEINSEGSSSTSLGGLISNKNYQSTQINSNGVGFINTGSDELLWGILGAVDYTGTSSFKIIPDYSSIKKSNENGVTFNSSSQCGVVVERQALTTVGLGQQKQLVVEAATLDNTALRFNYLKIDNYDSSAPAISSDSATCGLSSTTKGTLAVNTSTREASWVFSDRFFSNKAVNLNKPGDNNQYWGNADSVVGLSCEAGKGYAIWVGNNDALHEKEFRVGHTGELFCKAINGGGALSVASEAGTTYKVIAGTYKNIGGGAWVRVSVLPGNYNVVGGWATYDGTKNDGSPVNAPAIDWLGTELWVHNNAGNSQNLSWAFIYKEE